MTENTPFNDEWNKLQKAFWDNGGSNFIDSSNKTTDEHNETEPKQSLLFNQWLSDVDKCWQDHAEITSTDIDSLYKKISSTSRFFINFTESVSSKKQGENADELIKNFLKGFASETPSKEINSETRSNQQNKNSFVNSYSNADINTFWKHPPGFFTNQQQSLSTLSRLFEDAANNSEFSAAVEAYLIALQKYQLEFFNIFKISAIQVIEILSLNSDKPSSPKEIMSICLEVLEANYMMLISENSYSKA